jgi:hypothetical protein
MYHSHPLLNGAGFEVRNNLGMVKNIFTFEEAEAIVRLLNRRTGENARSRRRQRRAALHETTWGSNREQKHQS